MSLRIDTPNKLQSFFLKKKPEKGEVVLKQNRVYTLPSKAGLLFGAVLVICFLTSTNYNLNLGFAMTYLMAGLAVVNTLFTFRNLAYLRLTTGAAPSIFAGDMAQFSVHIENPQSLDRFALHIGFLEEGCVERTFDLTKQDRITIALHLPSKRRGYLRAPRVQLQTRFPLGLLRAWSVWYPDMQVLVFPTPEINPPPLPVSGDSNFEGKLQSGNEDFSGVKSYQQGDPLKHLAWKHIARIDVESGGNLVSKQFSSGATGDISIDFSALSPHVDLELRISRMCAWVIEADSKGLPYAFALGKQKLSANSSASHRTACLTALALYGLHSQAIDDSVGVVHD